MGALKNFPIRVTIMNIMVIMLLLVIADSLMLFTAEVVTGWSHITATIIIALALLNKSELTDRITSRCCTCYASRTLCDIPNNVIRFSSLTIAIASLTCAP